MTRTAAKSGEHIPVNPCSVGTFLLGARFERGIWKFLDLGNPDAPGIPVVTASDVPSPDECKQAARIAEPGMSNAVIHVDQDFCEQLMRQGAPHQGLYLGQITDVDGTALQLRRIWRTMPDILGKMPKTRARLAYLKAWQVFSGASTERTEAIERDDLIQILKETSRDIPEK